MNTRRISPRFRRRALKALVGGAGTIALSIPAFGQGKFPDRPVVIVVAFPPGGPSDVATRALVDELGNALGQPVVVENRPGANGKIGTLRVVNAEPDGYTMTMATGATHGIGPLLYKDLGYDPIKDFTPVAWITSTPNVLVVNKDFPARTLPELIKVAKSRKLNIGTAGQGSTQDMSSRLLARDAGFSFDLVHYKGSGPARTDVLAGHVPMMFDAASAAMPFITNGQLRAIAVTGAQRMPSLPDVPTVAETLPGFEVNAWYALLAPPRVPPAIVSALNKAVNVALASPAVKTRFATQGAEIIGGPPEKLAEQLLREKERWGRLIRDTGISYE